MIDLRIRSRISDEELAAKVGKICTPDDYNLLLTRDATVRKPDGSLLCIYRRQAFPKGLLEASYPTLHRLKQEQTDNRGAASGMPRIRTGAGSRTRTANVASAIVGAIDGKGSAYKFCRLTAWTGRQTEAFQELWPLFQAIAAEFARLVPDRYAAQMGYVDRTHPDWVVPGTPFTTITVNNTYPTGVHTDKGDLDAGFSNLTVLRRGTYSGGVFLFPAYRVGVDMQDGDLLLMDAHEYHGNTALHLESEDAERISVVAYYRTRIATCGSPTQEADRAVAHAEQLVTRRLERAAELAAAGTRRAAPARPRRSGTPLHPPAAEAA